VSGARFTVPAIRDFGGIMPYIQNTDREVREMLETIGVSTIGELFKSIPEEIRTKCHLNLPKQMSEMEVLQHINTLAAKNRAAGDYILFLGAGVYNHFIPALVDHLAGRAEFSTAYTPYQAEASQGVLQTIFEYQTLIAELTGTDISQASLYEGATALVEGIYLARAQNPKRTRVLVSKGIHKEYLQTLYTYSKNLELKIEEVGLSGGVTSVEKLKSIVNQETLCLAFQTPNFFGCIENGPAIVKAAHECGALAIAVVDPVSLGLLEAPGKYGADIVVGEAQSLGMPMSYGGPYLGFMGARNDYVRKMPGRIAGMTTDVDGNRGFVLTFQTREQHIRREKATSNICSNEALCALRAAIYMTTMGRKGMEQVANLCFQKAHYAAEEIRKVNGYGMRFNAPFFKEFAVSCPKPAEEINAALLKRKIVGGFDCGRFWPEEKNTLLLAVTEVNSKEEIDTLVKALGEIR
jgi:glycine dehydrogenase subunit 1